MERNRNTLSIDHHHPFCSLAFLRLADGFAPFLAGAKLPSMKDSAHSNFPWLSSLPRKVLQILSQVPSSSHICNRRQQVTGLGNSSGKSRHLAPVFNTHKIPSRQPRLSAQGRPPKGPPSSFGSSGLIFSHCSSVSIGFVLAIASHPPPVSSN
jgi:hypothetical protein